VTKLAMIKVVRHLPGEWGKVRWNVWWPCTPFASSYSYKILGPDRPAGCPTFAGL